MRNPGWLLEEKLTKVAWPGCQPGSLEPGGGGPWPLTGGGVGACGCCSVGWPGLAPGVMVVAGLGRLIVFAACLAAWMASRVFVAGTSVSILYFFAKCSLTFQGAPSQGSRETALLKNCFKINLEYSRRSRDRSEDLYREICSPEPSKVM